jgi:HSP20 family protein
MAMNRLGSGFDEIMPQTFSSMLDRFFRDSMLNREQLQQFSPSVDMSETEQGFELEVTLPGVKKEDIRLEFQQGRLTISGERHFKQEEKDKRHYFIESQYGSFSRSFQFPDTVKADNIEASYENGILRVMVPKDEQKTAKHQITIKGSGMESGDPAQQNLSENNQQQERPNPLKLRTSASKEKEKVK